MIIIYRNGRPECKMQHCIALRLEGIAVKSDAKNIIEQ